VTYDDVTRNEKAWSGAAALVMHLLFFALLFLGVSWQKRQPESAVVVDIWTSLPPLPQVKSAPPPAPEPEKPAPPKPAPKAAPKPPPKPDVKPVIKPDITLKDKLEKDRKLKDAQAQLEKERKLKDQAAVKEREDKARAAAVLKEQREREAVEAKRVAEQQAAQQAAANAAAVAQAELIEKYKRAISDKIRLRIAALPNVNPNARVEFEIIVLPGGEVLGVKMKSAANSTPAYNAAVERAIHLAQPLPLPPDPALMKYFRELNLIFHPEKK